VAAKGEIDVLDPAGYGALTITKAISIQGHGFAGLAVPSGNGITIAAGATDKINLRGLLLDGIGTGNDGIVFNTGASLNIQDCLIRSFASSSIFFVPSASSNLSVSNTVISDNGTTGVVVFPTGSGAVNGVLDHVEMENNGSSGLLVGGSTSTGTIKVTLSDSVAANNGQSGVAVVSTGAATTLMVRNSTIANNNDGLSAVEASAIIRVTHSTITGNGVGFRPFGGTLESFGDNALRGNTTDGAPTSTVALQ